MKNGFVFFVGLLAAIAISWGGVVLGAHRQLGGLAPFFDEGDGASFPARPQGIAARGQLVYADLGCASCHTQQVRRPDFGADQARGWGDRQSVARDYIFQIRPQLGASRVGPDLTNLAGRKPSPLDEEDLMKLLYAGTELHPAYAFLFKNEKIVGERSAKALKLTGQLGAAVGDGREIVPTERAQVLVAYLLGLNNTYEFPEARPLPKAPATKEGAHGAAAPAHDAKKEGDHK